MNARRIINEVPAASRLPFRYTINAYRGCSHACAYCFARPTHEYLGLGIGEDFERKLVVKVNAVERVRAELRSPRWRGEHIAMGTNTDPYQRAEGRYHLTRGIVDALGEARNPVLDPHQVDADPARPRPASSPPRPAPTCTATSPSARSTKRCGRPPSRARPHPRRRVEAVRRLNDAGIPTGVLMAPIIPGWSDSPEQLEEVATRLRRSRCRVRDAHRPAPASGGEGALPDVPEGAPSRPARRRWRVATPRSAYLPAGAAGRHRGTGPRRRRSRAPPPERGRHLRPSRRRRYALADDRRPGPDPTPPPSSQPAVTACRPERHP